MSVLNVGLELFGKRIRPATPRERTVPLLALGTAPAARGRALTGFRLLRAPADPVGVPPALEPGRYVPAAVYGVFFVMVMIGFRDWHREFRARIAQNPLREAVRR